MALFEQFPYTNFHGVNLSWILDKVRDHETRITSLEGRMTTAEDDIDALEGRMDTAEGDIDALEGRMDTAEGDIDALETQMPKSAAGSAGKVLTSTGAGTATWQDVPEELPARSAASDPYKLLICGAGAALSWGAQWGVGAAGNVLTVNNDATLGFNAIPKELPASLGSAGQVLTVNSDADGVEWADQSAIILEMGSVTVDQVRDAAEAAQAGRRVLLRYHVGGGSGSLSIDALMPCVKVGTYNQLFFPDYLRDAAGYSGYTPSYSGNTLSTKTYWVKVAVVGNAVQYSYNESQDVFPNT